MVAGGGYDIKVRGVTIQKGDRVLVKQVSFDGKHKLADTWEKVPYVVVDQVNSDIPVFNVTREDDEYFTETYLSILRCFVFNLSSVGSASYFHFLPLDVFGMGVPR
jgi:hypothetical protein